MNKKEALSLLKRREIITFNKYREDHPTWIPDFSDQDLSSILFFSGDESKAFNLDRANLCGAKLPSKYINYSGSGSRESAQVSMKGALIDAKTTGLKLDFYLSQGAQFVTGEQLAMRTAVSRIFISYAWANSDVVHAIDSWLRAKGLSTVIDKRDFFAGSRIRDEISRLMMDSDVTLVFHSKESRDKPWIDFERELLGDLQMTAKKEDRKPTRAIYIVIDDTPLPTVSEDNRIAILAKGKRFELVCEEIYHHILRLPRDADDVDLAKWDDYVF